jgi:hypothetical protein
MLQPLQISVKKTVAELRLYQKRFPYKFKALQMLLIIRQQGSLSKDKPTLLFRSGHSSVLSWRRIYLNGGIEAMVVDNRAGLRKQRLPA